MSYVKKPTTDSNTEEPWIDPNQRQLSISGNNKKEDRSIENKVRSNKYMAFFQRVFSWRFK